MSNLADQYYQNVRTQLETLVRTQREAIDLAAKLFSECLLQQRWIYLFGTGHSHVLAEELFYRAGGLPCIRPILCPDLMLHESAVESTAIERRIERVPTILQDYAMEADDVLVIASNSGRNAVPVELAIQAAALGVTVIAIVNRRHSERFDSRHPSGKKLKDVASLMLDNCGVPGDACVSLPDSDLKTGAASTVTGIVLLQMIVCATIEKAREAGWQPQLFQSANAGRESDNAVIIERLRRENVRHL